MVSSGGAGDDEDMVALGEPPREHDLLVGDATSRRDLAERVELGFVLGLAEAAQRAPAHEVQTDFRRVFQRIGGVR